MVTKTQPQTLHYVMCDKCGESGAAGPSAIAAQNWATRHGWHIGTTWNGRHADLCEECDAEVEEEGER